MGEESAWDIKETTTYYTQKAEVSARMDWLFRIQIYKKREVKLC